MTRTDNWSSFADNGICQPDTVRRRAILNFLVHSQRFPFATEIQREHQKLWYAQAGTGGHFGGRKGGCMVRKASSRVPPEYMNPYRQERLSRCSGSVRICWRLFMRLATISLTADSVKAA
jgi:hypothetical protein